MENIKEEPYLLARNSGLSWTDCLSSRTSVHEDAKRSRRVTRRVYVMRYLKPRAEMSRKRLQVVLLYRANGLGHTLAVRKPEHVA